MTRYKNIKKSWVIPALSLMLLIIIIWQVRDKISYDIIYENIVAHLSPNTYWGLGLVIAMAPLNWIFESLKWKTLMSKVQPMSFRTAFASVLTGMSFAFISPGKIGDFAGRILYIESKKRMRGVVATMVGSFAHIVVTCVMGSIGFLYLVTQSSLSIIWILASIVWVLTLAICFFYFRINAFTFKKIHKSRWINKIIIAFKVLKRYDTRILRRVLFFSFLKLSTYTSQFVIVSLLFGASLSFWEMYLVAAGMFWTIMIIPSFLLADVIVRGYVAHLLFVRTGLLQDDVAILAGTYLIWLVNWVIPSLIGALTLMIFKGIQKSRSKFTNDVVRNQP